MDITKDDLIAVRVEGKTTKDDYEKINPLKDNSISGNDYVKLYVRLEEIHSITPEAFMNDVKTYFKNFNKIKKNAVPGDSTWQKIITGMANPFIAG